MFLKWLYFALIQVIAFVCFLVGAVILLPMSALGLWTMRPSRFYPYEVLCWRFLDYVYGNAEDGIDGTRGYEKDPTGYWTYLQQPWIDRTVKWPQWLRVYYWSAWRNSANNLRFVFRMNGPFVRREWRGHYLQLGWNSEGFPVISAGKI